MFLPYALRNRKVVLVPPHRLQAASTTLVASLGAMSLANLKLGADSYRL